MKIEGERLYKQDVLPHYFRKLDPVSLHFLYSQLYISSLHNFTQIDIHLTYLIFWFSIHQ